MKKVFKSGFSMIELIFFMMIIGTLRSIGVSKMRNLGEQAVEPSLKSDIRSIIANINHCYSMNLSYKTCIQSDITLEKEVTNKLSKEGFEFTLNEGNYGKIKTPIDENTIPDIILYNDFQGDTYSVSYNDKTSIVVHDKNSTTNNSSSSDSEFSPIFVIVPVVLALIFIPLLIGGRNSNPSPSSNQERTTRNVESVNDLKQKSLNKEVKKTPITKTAPNKLKETNLRKEKLEKENRKIVL